MMSGQGMREREVPPRAGILIESLRDVGYSLQTAIADVIDNSLTGGARRIDLLAQTQSDSAAIGVLDDGAGMTEAELLEAMRPGSRSPRERREESDLGRFGLGLKTASFSQCRRLTVLTRKDGSMSCAVWDLDLVAEKDRWIVQLPGTAADVPWADRLTGNGTLVVWQKLDRLVGRGAARAERDLTRQVSETAEHVKFVFHRFLAGRGRVRIALNGQDLEPLDPFHSDHPATQHHPLETLSLGGRPIVIRPVTLPHHDKVTAAEWRRFAGPEGYAHNQGFYLYRNRRLIVHGTWFGLAKKAELTKLSRVQIDIPNSLDAEWKIDVKKASAQPPAPVRERLRQIVEGLGVPSKRAYRDRGARLTDPNRLPVWTRSQNKNRISYGLDLDHPVFSSFAAGLDRDRAREFQRLMKLVASSLPFDALFADVSSDPRRVVPPGLDANSLEALVQTTWCALRRTGLSAPEIEAALRSAEPFRSSWEPTLAVISRMSDEESPKRADAARAKLAERGVSEEDIADAVRWARSTEQSSG